MCHAKRVSHTLLDMRVSPSSFTRRLTLLALLFVAVVVSITTTIRSSQQPRSVKPVYHTTVVSAYAEWVILLHVKSGAPERLDMAQRTWFKSTSPALQLATFGSAPGVTFPDASPRADANTRLAFVAALSTFPSAKYFAKFDDDAYVYTKRLLQTIEAVNQSHPMYWGYPLNSYGITFASGGAGYILNRAAVQLLSSCRQDLSDYEDAALAQCLESRGVSLTPQPGLHPHNPWQMLKWDLGEHPSDHVYRKEPVEGYLHPLSYHYMSPEEMLRMHDEFNVHGSSVHSPIPKNLHQFWEGVVRQPPRFAVDSCRDLHSHRDGWTHYVWNRELISKLFPGGQLVNQNRYDLPDQPLNLLSDIARYELLLFFGGVYMDADSLCIQPVDTLLEEIVEEEGFCVYENEHRRADVEGHMLVATGVLALRAYSPIAIMLVLDLPNTNWGLPAWQSAGPLYATKALAALRTSHPELKMRYVSSHLFYPFHFEDAKPADPSVYQNELRTKGAYSDQLWGTTKGAYPQQSDLPGVKRAIAPKPETPGVWHALDKLLHTYAHTHEMALSVIHRSRPRWVIAKTDDAAGMCNRVMHFASVLLFAVLSGRAMLFDWEAVMPKKHYGEQVEIIGHAKFDDVFHPLPIAYSYEQARARLDAPAPSGPLWSYNNGFIDKIATQNIDSAFPESVVVIERYDWWGAVFFDNPHYRYILDRMTSADGFRALFTYLFRPKHMPPEVQCDWLFQIRRNWERTTAPVSAYSKCAVEHGLNAENDRICVLADTDKDMQQVHEYHRENAVGLGAACRDGEVACDVQTLHSLYRASTCKNAVLTHTSTFGACAVGLGMIAHSYNVKADGECVLRAHIDPVDSGVLDHQPRFIEQAIALAKDAPRNRRFAFVYLLIHPSHQQVTDLRTSLARLHEHFNVDHHYPIVMFVDSTERWQFLQAYTSVRLHFVLVQEYEWAVPDWVPVDAYPQTFLLPSVPQHHGFPVKYRQMSRFAAGRLFNHPYLVHNFDFVIKIDSDTFATGKWQGDPFERAVTAGKRAGYWVSYSDISDVTVMLDRTFKSFVSLHELGLKQKDLVYDTNGEYRRTNIYGCFAGFEPAWFDDPLYHMLFTHFDQEMGWFKYRWDEQKMFAFYIALTLDPSQVEFFSYISIEHQTIRVPVSM